MKEKINQFPLAELVVVKEKKPVSTCGTCCYERKNRFPLAELVVLKEKLVSLF
jgi:hypothetical protein